MRQRCVAWPVPVLWEFRQCDRHQIRAKTCTVKDSLREIKLAADATVAQMDGARHLPPKQLHKRSRSILRVGR